MIFLTLWKECKVNITRGTEKGTMIQEVLTREHWSSQYVRPQYVRISYYKYNMLISCHTIK